MQLTKLSWPAAAVVCAAMLSAAIYFGPYSRTGDQPQLAPPQRAELQPPLGLRVVRVIDGDTIIVRWRGMDEKVRLLNIDTPERGEPGYHEATDALRDLIGDRPVDLEWEEPGVPSRDQYGRLLAFVFITVPAGPPGGRIHINVEMVRGGWAEYYTKYGKGRYAGDFKVRANKVGEPRKLCLALAYNVWLVVESGMNVRKMQKKSLTSLYSGPILR